MPKTPTCRSCKRRDGSHTKGCTWTCAFCTRLAPEKCKWHGGRSHGAADLAKARAGKVTRATVATPKRVVRAAAERTPLAAGIARLKATVAAGRAAEAELAAIRKALAP